jgi:subtilisin family serine protease
VVSKLTKISAATILALSASTAAFADDDRFIIKVDSAKKGVIKALTKQMGGSVKVDANGFIAASFAGKSLSDVKGLLNNPHIQLIEEDTRRVPLAIYNDDAGDPNTQQLTPYALYQSQAVELQAAGYDLSSQKVCIIDSGLDSSNTDFEWGKISGDNDSGTGNWNQHGGPHGTHVAGTVAAADNGYGVIGMAPGVNLHIIKVFNEAGWGYSSDLAHAEQLCAASGANIITMSLGGGGANSTEENAFNDFTNNGGLVLAAAGNDGNNVRSFPAGYASVMMIGANDSDNNIASFSQFPSNTKTSGKGKNQTTVTDDGFGVEVSVGGVDTLSTYPAGLATVASLTAGGAGFASSAMENTGSASGSTYFMGTAEATDSGANGKVCVIDRGVISFHDKVQNCENSGGVGAVIINNNADGGGMLYATLGDTNATTIPAVGAAYEDRAGIVAASTAALSVAPGNYGFMSGTSMATPGAAGMAALIWSNNPACTGTEIRQAMKDTAEDQGAAGRDDYFGYGIVKAKAASDSLNNCGGTPPTGNTAPVASFTYSCTDLACDFNGSASSDSDGSIASYSWSFGGTTATASHTFAAAGTYTATLTVTDNEGATNSTSQSVTVTDGSVEPPAGDITLTGTRSGNGRSVTINWTGAAGTNVDIYVNGSFNNTTANDGSNTYSVNKRNSYTFSVCEEGSTTACSNSITL